MMHLTNSLISRDVTVKVCVCVALQKRLAMERIVLSDLSAEVTFLTLLNRNSITDLAFLMITLLLYTCEFQTSVKRCKLADAGMRNVCVCARICSSILSLIWLNVCLFLGANPLFLSYWLQMHYWLGYLLHVELPFSFCINNAGKRCVLEQGRCSEMIDGRLFDFNALSLGCSLAAPGLVLVFSRSSCWRWKSPYPSPPPSSLTHMRNDKWIVVTPSTAIILQAFQSVHIDCAAIMVALAFFFFHNSRLLICCSCLRLPVSH